MQAPVPVSELKARLDRFRDLMDRENPSWELSAIFGRVSQYYFTGTMQDGLLLVPRDGEAVLWVRRSFERACAESLFPAIRPMNSFRDAAKAMQRTAGIIHLETEIVPLALLQRFRKYFPAQETGALDLQVAKIRSVKSAYELDLMEKAGRIHRHVLEDVIPGMLAEGMNEAELGAGIYSAMVKEGHQGIVRFGMFGTEIEVGQIAFGVNSLCPTAFNGPGGCRGIGPAAPVLGSTDRKLARGDLVFVDNACGFEGYQTDKTMTYMFGESLPDPAIGAHHRCVEIQDEMAALLKPGITPAQIYATIMDRLESEFRANFMGFGNRQVNFLGHGTGLLVDGYPVIAAGFDEPLREGMTIALEPKKGIAGVGMVGIENTFVVTPQGGRSITGTSPGLIPVF